jgi:AcrR family transcriptional regulator
MAKKSTRDMIIGVAAGLFATVGLRRTTMEAIAADAGRGRRTIYMYFRNKAEVYDAVVSMEISRIINPLLDVIANGKSFESTLHNYSYERIRALYDLSKRNQLLMRDFAQGHSRVEKLRDKLDKEELKILVPFFKLYREKQNRSYKAAPEDYAQIFINMLRGNDRLLVSADSFERAVQMSVLSTDLFIKGMGTIRN